MRRLLLAALLVLLLPGTAGGAGTGGIEVSPYPGVVDGEQLTAFHVDVPSRGDARVRYSLRNTTGTARSARLYAAAAASDGKGGWTIGDAGSSPYLAFPDRTVTLKPRETRLEEFRVHGDLDGKQTGAVVVEVTNGTVTQRAATLVYLEPGRTVPLPLLLVLLAAGLVAVLLGAVVLVRRKDQSRT